MRIAGRRADGALHLVLGGGLSVILRADTASPPSDAAAAAKLGPWHLSDDSLAHRQIIAKRLDRAKVVPLYSLAMSFDEKRERVMGALRKQFGFPSVSSYGIGGSMDVWIPSNGIGDDWVVYCVGSPQKHYAVGYEMTPTGEVAFDGTPDEVAPSWETMKERAEGQEVDASEKKKAKSSWWKKIEATNMPGSLPNLGSLTDMPGSIPNAGSKLVG